MNGQSIRTLVNLKIGAPTTMKNLTLFPLSGNPAASLKYLMIDEALDSGKAAIEEASEGGVVQELRLVNSSTKVLLIPDGTELVGAKQNRIVNAVKRHLKVYQFATPKVYHPDWLITPASPL